MLLYTMLCCITNNESVRNKCNYGFPVFPKPYDDVMIAVY